MDTKTSYHEVVCNTLGTSITGGYFPPGELGLRKFIPSKLDAIIVVDSFDFDNTKG